MVEGFWGQRQGTLAGCKCRLQAARAGLRDGGVGCRAAQRVGFTPTADRGSSAIGTCLRRPSRLHGLQPQSDGPPFSATRPVPCQRRLGSRYTCPFGSAACTPCPRNANEKRSFQRSLERPLCEFSSTSLLHQFRYAQLPRAASASTLTGAATALTPFPFCS